MLKRILFVSRDYLLFLEDVRDSCEKVLRYTRGLTLEEWLTTDVVYDATMHNLEIIGEAIGHIPQEVRDRHREVEWQRIKAFRNVVAHHYFGIDENIVWDVVTNKVPVLSEQIQQVIRAEINLSDLAKGSDE
jgi:uncharacterized protein with HEPN domain